MKYKARACRSKSRMTELPTKPEEKSDGKIEIPLEVPVLTLNEHAAGVPKGHAGSDVQVECKARLKRELRRIRVEAKRGRKNCA